MRILRPLVEDVISTGSTEFFMAYPCSSACFKCEEQVVGLNRIDEHSMIKPIKVHCFSF